MSKVFISYGNQARKVAEGLCAHLEERGLPCWMAPRDISSGTYAGEITRAIKAADIMVAIFSKASRSEHVKNEVNVAFNNAKLILPYCLDDSPFDDDLEYWLSAKQRIISFGNIPADYQRIERIIREYRGEDPAASPQIPAQPQQPAPSQKRSLLLPLICVAVLLVGAMLYFLRQEKPSGKEDIQLPIDSLTVILPADNTPTGTSIQPVVKQPKQKEEADPDADIFDGKIVDGYPDGSGKLTFKKSRRIDMHDEKGLVAEPGDYIEGNWNHGHLNYGEWYGSDGKMKAFITLGDNPDYKLDHQLGKCVKP